MSKALSIVGSSRRNGQREVYDFYPTPPYAVLELLRREIFSGTVWECACGDGSISDVFERKGFDIYSSDIIDRGYGGTLDFLQSNFRVDNIITNPPYKLALEFIYQAKRLSRRKIALFLKTVFLEGVRRYDMFQDTRFPLKTIYQFSKRVTLTKNGVSMENKGMIAYAWYVWDKSYVGKTTIEWIH